MSLTPGLRTGVYGHADAQAVSTAFLRKCNREAIGSGSVVGAVNHLAEAGR